MQYTFLIFRFSLQPDLISSHRSMITRCECVEVIDGRSKGDPVVLLLFTDTLEICCKRRNKAFATLRGTRGLQKLTKSKQYKHLRLVPLSNVRKVVDIRDSEGKLKGYFLDTLLISFGYGDYTA